VCVHACMHVYHTKVPTEAANRSQVVEVLVKRFQLSMINSHPGHFGAIVVCLKKKTLTNIAPIYPAVKWIPVVHCGETPGNLLRLHLHFICVYCVCLCVLTFVLCVHLLLALPGPSCEECWEILNKICVPRMGI